MHQFVDKFRISAVCAILGLIFLADGAIPAFAQTVTNFPTSPARVTISVSLGEPVLKLWGYGAPSQRVELTGDRVADFTYTRSDGYFEFLKTYLPQTSNLFYPELCLTGIDLTGRSTPPTCIPPLPVASSSYDIGPVILPPTLSLDAGVIDISNQAGASGVTIPNSDIKIVLAEDRGSPDLSAFSIVRLARAYYIPSYTIRSDSGGNFSFNMPAGSPKTWRVFAITEYSQGATSPKSNTLKFDVQSPVVTAIISLWKFILSLLTLPVFIILEIVVILLILAVLFLKKKKRNKVYPNDSSPIIQYQNYLKSKRLI
jgi:hypothetical protein